MRYSSNGILSGMVYFINRHSYVTRMALLIILCFTLAVCYKAGNYKPDDTNTEEWEYTLERDNFDERLKERFEYLTCTDNDFYESSVSYTHVNLDEMSEEVFIAYPGDYLLSGSLDGTIRINAPEQTVHLYFDNVSIKSKAGPAINVVEAEKVIITLVDGTNNTVKDSGHYDASAKTDASIFSRGNLTFNGQGTLTVYGYYKDAIASKDVVKIVSGSYYLYSKRNAVFANEGIHILGGEFTVSSEKNGFRTEKKGEGGRGNIMLSGGNYSIIAGQYGLLSEKASVYIFDSSISQRCVIDFCSAGVRAAVEEGCLK